MSRSAIVGIFFVALLGAASPAMAQFRISGGLGYPFNPTGARDSFFYNSLVPVGDEVMFAGTDNGGGSFNRGWYAQTSAVAGAGYLQSTSNRRYQQDFRQSTSGSSNIYFSGSNFAEFTLVDLVITGPAGPITTSINFRLSGDQVTSAINNPAVGEQQARGTSTVQLLANVNNVTVGSGFKTIKSDYLGTGLDSSSGWLTNWSLDGIVTSADFIVNANQPFTVMMQLQTSAFAYAYTGHFGGSAAAADFSHTASFATNGPVFNLPAGYSVSSASVNLTGNAFSIPEPGSLMILTAAAAIAACHRRRRPR